MDERKVELCEEWVALIKEAKKLGLTIDELRPMFRPGYRFEPFKRPGASDEDTSLTRL